MDRYYVPDWNIDPPEDDRKIVGHCEECEEPIRAYEDVIYSEYLVANFCNMDCLKENLGVSERYYEED